MLLTSLRTGFPDTLFYVNSCALQTSGHIYYLAFCGRRRPPKLTVPLALHPVPPPLFSQTRWLKLLVAAAAVAGRRS